MGSWIDKSLNVTAAISALFLVSFVVGVGIIVSVKVLQDPHDLMLDQTVVVSTSGGHGSGVVIGPRTVLTVGHVAERSKEFDVMFRDGRMVKAKPLWVGSGEFDAAILLLEEPTSIAPARLSCDPPLGGQKLTAVGNPLDNRWVETPITVGSNSVFGMRPYKTLVIGFIAPGMSGGPAFDESGKVVGLVQSLRTMALGMLPFPTSISGIGFITSGAALCLAGLG